jgi:hypothetical protein
MLNWIIKLIPDSLIKKVIAGQIRHLIGALGTLLAAMTIPEVAQIGQLILANIDPIVAKVVSIALVAYAFLASWLSKKIDAK